MNLHVQPQILSGINKQSLYLKASLLGVVALWGDCTFIPADCTANIFNVIFTLFFIILYF